MISGFNPDRPELHTQFKELAVLAKEDKFGVRIDAEQVFSAWAANPEGDLCLRVPVLFGKPKKEAQYAVVLDAFWQVVGALPGPSDQYEIVEDWPPREKMTSAKGSLAIRRNKMAAAF